MRKRAPTIKTGIFDIAKYLAEELGTSRKNAKDVLRVVIEQLGKGMMEGEIIRLPDFGTFQVIFTKGRKMFLPKTKKWYDAPDRRRITFRSAASLRRAMNEDNPSGRDYEFAKRKKYKGPKKVPPVVINRNKDV